MSVEFSVQNIMQILADTIFGGDTSIASLSVMLALFFAMMALFAAIKAPPTYAVLPMILVDVLFMALGVMDNTIGIIIIIISIVMVGRYAAGAILWGDK